MQGNWHGYLVDSRSSVRSTDFTLMQLMVRDGAPNPIHSNILITNSTENRCRILPL